MSVERFESNFGRSGHVSSFQPFMHLQNSSDFLSAHEVGLTVRLVLCPVVLWGLSQSLIRWQHIVFEVILMRLQVVTGERLDPVASQCCPRFFTDGSELGSSLQSFNHFTSFSFRRFAIKWLWFAPGLQHSPQCSFSRFDFCHPIAGLLFLHNL